MSLVVCIEYNLVDLSLLIPERDLIPESHPDYPLDGFSFFYSGNNCSHRIPMESIEKLPKSQGII